MKDVLRIIDLPPVWLAGFAALTWLVGQWLGGAPGGWARAAGWVLIGAGVVLVLLAGIEFLRHRTTIIPGQPPRALIDTGIFALTRNPIYLGDALVLAGLAVLWGAWPALILVPVFLRVISFRFIRWEEARLLDSFGNLARDYMAQVRRWI